MAPILIWGASIVVAIALGWLIVSTLLPDAGSEEPVAVSQSTPTSQVNPIVATEDWSAMLPTSSPEPVNTAAPHTFFPSSTATELTLTDIPALQQQMLTLVNEVRMANGLSQLSWDTTATLAGQRHAEDMAQFNYFSHWNRDGLGPDHRYSQIGGQYAVMENLHAFSYTFDNGQGAPITDWSQRIQDAHDGLLNSPGHRANILDPAHTHVGIGMAYNPQTGQFRLAQEFTNQYTRLAQPLPRQVASGESFLVQGQFVGTAFDNPLLQLAYEPFPQPLSLAELAETNVYSSVAEDVETRPIELTFAEVVVLNQPGAAPPPPGFYHLRLFVDVQGQQALVVDHLIEVR